MNRSTCGSIQLQCLLQAFKNFNSYLTQNTVSVHYKMKWVMIYMEVMDIYFANQTKHIPFAHCVDKIQSF
jgi:hypothetical protein